MTPNPRTEIANQARKKMANALGLLQRGGLPNELRSGAEAVARSMGLLHHIETVPDAQPAALTHALDAVREALTTLQQSTGTHPAAAQASEVVAGALGLVHSLAPPPAARKGARPALTAKTLLIGEGARVINPRAVPNTQPSALASVAPAFVAPPASALRKPRAARSDAMPNGHSKPAGSVEAALGAHSSTNFYRGLNSDSVVEGGGIFVATYQIPALGAAVQLQILLPGGYEFSAQGVVEWTRDTRAEIQGGQHAPPGFGARFTTLSDEGRQLIERYASHREPLFYDDR